MILPSLAVEQLLAAGAHKVLMTNAQPYLDNIALDDTIEAQTAELITHYMRRVQELLVTNNQYLERARSAERGQGLGPSCDKPVDMTPSVTARDLRNVLALLMSIDRHEIVAAGYDMPDGSWEEFREVPWTRFLKCNDECREAIVRVINSRMREAAIRYVPMHDALTPDLLADAFDAFWNAALTHAQQEGDSATYYTIGAMATGFAAVAQRLRDGDAA